MSNLIENYRAKYVGELVIVISIENENLFVGEGLEVVVSTFNTPALAVRDIITDEVKIVSGVILRYTQQKFDALNDMDANARIAVMFDDYYWDVEVNKKPTKQLYKPNLWKTIIHLAVQSYYASKTATKMTHD